MEIAFRARDGFALAGDRFDPAATARAAVVVASAMGVPRRFYQAFASFLAENGIASLTFDYRGIGGSRPPGALSRVRAALHEWGEEDLSGAIGFAERAWPGAPVCLVGHSVGGQLVGLAEGSERLAAMLFVASQSGYWRLWPWPARWRMVATWHVAIPAITRGLGYLPLRRLGGGADVPGGVALEWARWGSHPRYVLSWADTRPDSRYATLACPLRSLAISDDRFYAPRKPVEALVAIYPRTQSEIVTVTPSQAGVPSIGHFGYFRGAHRAKLWPEAVAWLAGAAVR
jgi:predicted alpha/beta hydrolase